MKFARFIPAALFLLVFITGIILSPHIGVAWDEPDNIHAGGVYWNFFKSGFDQSILQSEEDTSIYADIIFTQESTIARYPPVPNYLGTAIAEFRGYSDDIHADEQIIESFHIASAIFFGVLVVYVYLWGQFIGFPFAVSVGAALSVFLFPTVFGHGFSNLKDIAQMSLFVVSLYHLARGVRRLWIGHVLTGAVVWGLAMATKFNAIYIPVILAVWIVITKQYRKWKGMTRGAPAILVAIILWVVTVLVGIGVMIGVWPYLWQDTMTRIMEVVSYFTTVGQGYRVFWNGTTIQVGSGTSFWWYPWANVWIVTPPVLLVSILIGVTSFGIYTIPRFRSQMRILGIKYDIVALFCIWILLPFARAILPNAAFYDGIRHFMEVLMPIIMLGWVGVVFVWMKMRFVIKATYQKVIIGALLGLAMLVPMVQINHQYFPYSTGYYNFFAANPNELFDRDIEGLSVKEAMDEIHRISDRFAVWAPVSGHQSWYYVEAGDQYVYSEQEADWIILINKSSHVNKEEFTQLVSEYHTIDHEIRRGDAVFAWIYRRKGG